ncbi:hypothetical protein KFK09_005507 [Dendrobium nobile]|uniref:DEA(D/H)-box RNA helicase family protein n=1 Tax=Dendrobium nobile TaxID=94219 RepID=A0A8T3BW07_DENNO|nr:hypothetical protein KFK09_005507 [Dendrobium nobile]
MKSFPPLSFLGVRVGPANHLSTPLVAVVGGNPVRHLRRDSRSRSSWRPENRPKHAFSARGGMGPRSDAYDDAGNHLNLASIFVANRRTAPCTPLLAVVGWDPGAARMAKRGSKGLHYCGLRKFGPGLRSLFLFGEGVLTNKFRGFTPLRSVLALAITGICGAIWRQNHSVQGPRVIRLPAVPFGGETAGAYIHCISSTFLAVDQLQVHLQCPNQVHVCPKSLDIRSKIRQPPGIAPVSTPKRYVSRSGVCRFVASEKKKGFSVDCNSNKLFDRIIITHYPFLLITFQHIIPYNSTLISSIIGLFTDFKSRPGLILRLVTTSISSHRNLTLKLIFQNPPPNVRKIVLATNMAEASITINDIVFVVDCGKAKETTYDALNNTPCLLPSWISKASAQQRRGRAGRVQPGECYHLYPKCVYDAFADYQLPELLRTPLNSLCLQIKSLQLGSITQFLSASMQPPEPLAVQNAVEFLKMISALDENENLTNLGRYLSMLPVDPKLGKMLIMGAVFRCFDPVLTVVSGLSARDPFLLPQDKKDLAGTAKSRFSAKDYSDHMALVRAYEGWKDADREGSAYEYCWRNFLSSQTLQAIHSFRKQFSFILRDAGLLETDASTCNSLSHNQSLVRAIICSGLFPGISSVVHREKSLSFKTMDDGQVLLYANSVNAKYQTIPYPWLVFGEKVKVNAVFIRDSTGVSDSMLILFGGALKKGDMAGHLKMLDGYIDFFMDPSLAECYWKLKEELNMIIQKKLEDTSLDIHKIGKYLLLSIQELVSGDLCEGRFVFGRETKRIRTCTTSEDSTSKFTKGGTNPKSLLQTLLMRAGHTPPKYKTRHLKTNEFRALVEFKGMQFVGKPKRNKQLAERDAAIEALEWLTHTTADDSQPKEDEDSPPDITDNMLKLLNRRRRRRCSRQGSG